MHLFNSKKITGLGDYNYNTANVHVIGLLRAIILLERVDYLGCVVERSYFGHFVLHSRIVGELCERSAC